MKVAIIVKKREDPQEALRHLKSRMGVSPLKSSRVLDW
jgi:hypothetical protein